MLLFKSAEKAPRSQSVTCKPSRKRFPNKWHLIVPKNNESYRKIIRSSENAGNYNCEPNQSSGCSNCGTEDTKNCSELRSKHIFKRKERQPIGGK